MTEIQQKIFALADETYRDFSVRLIPNVDPSTVIGVRTPALRALAKELYGTPEGDRFLSSPKHEYFEENNLHAFMLDRIKNYTECVEAVERFLPYIDNWATCDQLRAHALGKEPEKLYVTAEKWIKSGKTYTVRFGIGTLMSYFLDSRFTVEAPILVAGIRSDEYYVRMMQAWYFATALAKQYDSVLTFIENKTLDAWTHNKAIQKAVESRRLDDTQKRYLRTLKV